MKQISNREAIKAAAECGSNMINDMRLAIAAACDIPGCNVTEGKTVNNDQTGMRHQIFDVTYSDSHGSTKGAARQRVFIPLNFSGPGVDLTRLDWDSSDFSLGRPCYA